MEISEIGAQLLSENLGLDVDANTIATALSGLLGDGQGGIDLAGLANKMTQNGDLGSLVSSWLGDGANGAISADSLTGLLGEGGVASFAQSVGIDPANAAQGLADMLPQVMDQASSGGSLLEAAGGLDGLLGAAKSFLS